MILRLETSAGASLVIDRGHIAAPAVQADRIVQVGAGQFHPGLINAHDHLHRNHYPRLGAPPYPDAYEWGADIHARCADEIARVKALDRTDALLFGAFKNIIAGVTTVVHHDAWEPIFDRQFPVRVAAVRTLHSLGNEPDIATAASASNAPGAAPLCIHLAEGTNTRAAGEVQELDALGLLNEQLLAVHAVGVDAAGIALLKERGAAVIWCPTSNCFLFRATAPQPLLAGDIAVLLGSDSLLTGAGTLLDELSAARAFGFLHDHALARAVGSVAARRLGLSAPSLDVGAAADVIVLRKPLLDARPADVALVLVGGRPVLADATIAGLPEDAVETIEIGGVTKVMPASLVRAARRAFQLTPECERILQ
jgi:cytosine/adenosine deaminase-related metal-dependent hydrolase